MNEKCEVCERPKGDPHRYPVAGECTAPDSSDYTVSLQCLSIALRKAQDDVKAAEERGRRCGLEERDELRAALIEVRENHALAGDDPFNTQLCWRCSEKWPCLTARTIDAALAPRDSARDAKENRK